MPASEPALSEALRQRGGVVWLTGLSGSGKTTIAHELARQLRLEGRCVCVLDGDDVRRHLSRDLGFSAADRHEHLRRVAEVARLCADAGAIAIAACISPYRADRAQARAIAGDRPFLEVHIATPLAACERRDPKGLYRLARSGALPGFTGLDDPYEPPETPDLITETEGREVAACSGEIHAELRRRLGWGMAAGAGGSGL